MTLDELREYAGFATNSSNIDPGNVFDVWNLEKQKINAKQNFPHPKRRQIWWFTIGKNIGQEQSCAVGFERPVIVIKVYGNVFWGLPITSSDKDKKKEKNPLYVKLDGMEYEDEDGSIKELSGFVAIHHLKTFDCRRLIRKLSRLDEDNFNYITKKIREQIV